MSKYTTTVGRKSERELLVTRTFDAPARIVYAAWTTPALMMRWWAPKSIGVPLRSCEQDVRVGGRYRLEFGHDESQTFAFFGQYTEVVPGERLVWTNEESDDGVISTVTFEEKDGKTLLVFTELYPTPEAVEEGMGTGMAEQFEQLDELLAILGSGA